ncbi:hypothetical protein [Streptomyces sp. NPDC053079]
MTGKRACPDCEGKGGRVEEIRRNGGGRRKVVVHRTWRTCTTCRGSGVRS